MEMEVGSVYFNSKLGWQSLTEALMRPENSAQVIWGEKSSGLSCTLQINNPAAPQNPGSSSTGHRLRNKPEGTAAGWSCLILLTSSHRESGRQRYGGVSASLRVSEGMCERVFLHCSVMFKWEWGVIFLFPSRGLALCSKVASPCCMSEGADSFHFP